MSGFHPSLCPRPPACLRASPPSSCCLLPHSPFSPFLRYPDSYKRRGQARSALGDHAGALADLTKAAKLLAEAPALDGADGGGGLADCHLGG